jgi:Amt family ammonium transporter
LFHLVGGLVGTLLIGLFGTTSVNSAGADGLFYGGGFGLLGKQAIAAVAVLAFSFVLTFIIAFVVNKTVGFRAAEESEVGGIDEAEHAESAYEFGAFSSARGANKGSVTAGATAVLEGSNKS